MAIGVRESARRLGLRVPEDLSVIGIDDYVLSEVLGLTTVRQDVAGQGHAAADLLLRALHDDDERPRRRAADRAHRARVDRPRPRAQLMVESSLASSSGSRR